MLVYCFTTVVGAWFAALAGSRGLPGPEGKLGPPRRGISALMLGATICLFAGVAGLRYRVGADYWQYDALWLRGRTRFTWEEVTYDSESGFAALSTLAAWFYDDSASMFFLASIVTVGLMVATYAKYSPMFALSILLMVLVGAWHDSFNGVRQFLAAAIVLTGHGMIVGRRFKPYLVVVALASLFHFSAWICLLFYFVPRRRLGFAGQLLLVGLAIVAVGSYDALGSVVDAVRGDNVSDGTYFAEQVSPLRVALAFVPYTAARLFARDEDLSISGRHLSNMALIHGVIFLVAISSAYLARFAIYSEVFLPLIWARILPACTANTRRWLMPLVVILYAMYWYLEVSRASSLNNFMWIWNAND